MRRALFGFMTGILVAAFFGAAFILSAETCSAQEDIQKFPSCPLCGMDRTKFAHSRVYVEYDDGTAFGTCSIHCAAVEMATQYDKSPKSVWVGDRNTKELVNAEEAYWVIDEKNPGVMTRRGKWAFGEKEDAEAYISDHDGARLAEYEEVMEATFVDMYKDLQMIRKKRAMKRMKMQGSHK